MTEYRFARPEEEPEVLDFINAVFSQAVRPHDFEKLIPKVYAHPGFAEMHAVAVEERRIRGAVAMLPMIVHGGESSLGVAPRGAQLQTSDALHPLARRAA